MKHNGVSYDYLFCKLFPHSLGGEAAYWLKQLPTGCLTNWEDTKRTFLRNFYDDARSEDLRNNISQFTQRPTEAFKAAWVRFRSYQRDCPHHGYSEAQLLGTFFRGVDWRYQMALDSASDGNFNTRSPEQAVKLIENLASSNSTKNADFERQKIAGNADSKQMAELKNKLDSVHNILVNKKSVQFAAEVETFEPEEDCEEDVNYIGGNGYQGQRFGNQQNRGGYSGYGQRSNYTSNQNSSGYDSKPQYQKPLQTTTSFTRNYGSSSYQKPPASNEQDEIKAMIDRVLEGQQKMSVDFNGKLDAVYADLNGKFESLSAHVKKLDVQVAQTAEAVKRREGVLPGSTDINPKYQCGVILAEEEPSAATFVKNGEETASEAVVSIDTTSVSIDTESISLDLIQAARVDRHNPCVARHKHPSDEENLAKSQETAEWMSKPTIPFQSSPTNVEAAIAEIRADKFIHPRFSDPKTRTTRVDSSSYYDDRPLRELPKIEDPGKFLIPCYIAGVEFEDSIADSGSHVNLMSKDIADSLGLTTTKPSGMYITFANAQVANPPFIEKVPVRIGNCIVPTDFHVLEMGGHKYMPLILGRSFLATSGAVFDLPNARVCLSNVSKRVFYPARPDKQYSTYISGKEKQLDFVKAEEPICKVEIAVDKVPSRTIVSAARKDPEVNTKGKPKKRPANKKDKPKRQPYTSSATITLTPLKRVGDTIEYKLKTKGGSRPFSKVKAIITSEAKEKGQAFIEDMLLKVLELNLHGNTASRSRPGTAPPRPNTPGDSHKA